MRGNLLTIIIIFIVFLSIDIYVFQGIKALLNNPSPLSRRLIYGFYWGLSVILFTVFLLFVFGQGRDWSRATKTFFMSIQVITLFPKIFFSIFLLIDDLQRGIRWVAEKASVLFGSEPAATDISRSEFLLKTGLVVATVPLVSISYGVMKGAHDYRIKRVQLPLKNLPSSFHGLKIAQISDIHTGSFFNKKAVTTGVELLMREKPDVAFFTGDLVNETSDEVKDYLDVFNKVKAPLGVFSILGNHDYGDYVAWPSLQAKINNLNQLKAAHKFMGYDLLLNENRILTQSGDSIAILGVENWGKGHNWPKHGRLDLAHKGTEDTAVKLLLSHDPTHWDAQVRPNYNDIDVMFAGHTHGCQLGVEIGGFRWSPAQYIYKQWAGLYQEENQRLYVNQGYGFIGFPGRVGMPPEITVFELVKG